MATDLLHPYLAHHARRLGEFFGARIAYCAADAEHLPFASQSIDRLYSQMILYRLPDPAQAIAEAWRVLAPHGHWLAVERAAPWAQPWLAHERARVAAETVAVGLSERAVTRHEWQELFAGLPARFTWAGGQVGRRILNATRVKHLAIEVRRPA